MGRSRGISAVYFYYGAESRYSIVSGKEKAADF